MKCRRELRFWYRKMSEIPGIGCLKTYFTDFRCIILVVRNFKCEFIKLFLKFIQNENYLPLNVHVFRKITFFMK
jgi:hypothetical protein